VSSAQQREKARAAYARYYAAHPEKVKARQRVYRAAHADKLKAAKARWQAANPEKCKAAKARYRAANRDKMNAWRRAWRDANPDKTKAYQAKWQITNRDRRKVARRTSIYGKGSQEHREAQIKKQHGCCAICDRPFKSSKDTHFDHNHLTGQWRGVLCRKCNAAFGLFGEDTGTLRKAIWYAQQWRRKAQPRCDEATLVSVSSAGTVLEVLE
jgi:Recombination endonuclease VII